MKESGVNVNIFGSHLTRSASTSNCKISGLSFEEVSKSAGCRMKKHLQNLMIIQFKRTFRTIYLKFAVLNICTYGVIYMGNMYGANYS